MFGSDGHGLLICRCDQCASCQVVGFSEQAAGALVNGGKGRIVKKGVFDAGEGEVVGEIFLHLFSVHGLQVASGDDSGSQGHGRLIREQVDKAGLACKDDRQPRL